MSVTQWLLTAVVCTPLRLVLINKLRMDAAASTSGLETSPAKPHRHLSPLVMTFHEIILAPHSNAEGKTLKEIDFRQRFGLTIVALTRARQKSDTMVCLICRCLLISSGLRLVHTRKRRKQAYGITLVWNGSAAASLAWRSTVS